MTKIIEYSFRDWENDTFGFGYGTGEWHTIPALRKFLELCNEGHYGTAYDYCKLEAELTPIVAWLLINILCKADILEYGSSPRMAWLTGKGKRLKEFMRTRTDDDLITLVCETPEDYTPCYHKVCNCGPKGFEEGRVCENPFWRN